MPNYTIGRLAKRLGLAPSTLRYYEDQKLLKPPARTEAGYRIYDAEAEDRLRFIQRAQRIGFSLADIRNLLEGLEQGAMGGERVAALAEARYLEIERQLAELQVLRHELELFLLDFRGRMAAKGADPADSLYDDLVQHICGHGDHTSLAVSSLEWLLDRTGCSLAADGLDSVVEPLRGQHFHVWKSDDEFHILVPGDEPAIGEALGELGRMEAECHAHETPSVDKVDEGWLFVARGDRAFLFAQFFLNLENEGGSRKPLNDIGA